MKLGFVFATFSISAAFANGATLSLKEAVRFAVENSPVVDTARKTTAIRDLEFKNAIAKMLPSADISGTHGLQNNIPIGGNNTLLTSNPASPWYSSLNLSVTENLYDNGVSITNARIADLNRELSAVAFQKARDSVSLNLANEFYKFSLATELLEVRKQQQAILDKQFKNLSSQYEQGFKTKSDYLRLKTQVQRAEIDRVTAQNSIALSRAELLKILGAQINPSEQIAFTPQPVKRDFRLDSVLPGIAPTFESIFDSRIAKIQSEINGKSVTLAKRNYWPRVSVTSGFTYTNINYLNSTVPYSATDQLSWNALLTLQYNIWDWGSRRRDVEIAEHNRDIQGNTIQQGLLDSNAQVSSLMLDVGRIGKNLKLSQELLSLEEESNRNVDLQYREGKVTYLDLITSLNSLLDAKVQFCTSYFDALQAIARYRYFEGKLYETLVQ